MPISALRSRLAVGGVREAVRRRREGTLGYRQPLVVYPRDVLQAYSAGDAVVGPGGFLRVVELQECRTVELVVWRVRIHIQQMEELSRACFYVDTRGNERPGNDKRRAKSAAYRTSCPSLRCCALSLVIVPSNTMAMRSYFRCDPSHYW